MQHFRAKLTRLKNLVDQKLPEGNDLYGFSGINKSMLIAGIELAHQISHEIEEKDEYSSFEVVMLKRTGARIYESAKDKLDDGFLDAMLGNGRKKRFDEFLTLITRLIESTKMTYFIVAKDGIHTDHELSEMRTSLGSYIELHESFKKTKEELEPNVAVIEEQLNFVSTAQSKASGLLDDVVNFHSTAEESFSNITQIHENIDGWDAEINERKVSIVDLENKIELLKKTIESLSDQLQDQVNDGTTSLEVLDNLKSENKSMADEIRETLGNANRVGMGASFKQRKEELGKVLLTWGVVFGGAIIGIVISSYILVIPELNTPEIDWRLVYSKIPVILPLVWLGWFAAKQYMITGRIREDYAFKYAASMSYEGYKKATREVDERLETGLLEFSISNMAQNPIRLYSKHPESVTPVHEITNSMLDRVFKKTPKPNHEPSPIKKLEAEIVETPPS